MSDEHKREPVQDELAEQAGELILEAEQQYQQNLAEQEAFLETVAEEEGAEVLETTCTIMGDITVPLKAKMNGDLIDRMSHVQETGRDIEENPETEGYKISRLADEMCQILADVVDDSSFNKRTFYQAYQSEGLDPMLSMIDRAFDSLQTERERKEGTAKGFRSEPGGS